MGRWVEKWRKNQIPFIDGLFQTVEKEECQSQEFQNNSFKVCFKRFEKGPLGLTRKYPLRGYFLGVLTHTTAWDRP